MYLSVWLSSCDQYHGEDLRTWHLPTRWSRRSLLECLRAISKNINGKLMGRENTQFKNLRELHKHWNETVRPPLPTPNLHKGEDKSTLCKWAPGKCTGTQFEMHSNAISMQCGLFHINDEWDTKKLTVLSTHELRQFGTGNWCSQPTVDLFPRHWTRLNSQEVLKWWI